MRLTELEYQAGETSQGRTAIPKSKKKILNYVFLLENFLLPMVYEEHSKE